MGKRGPNCLTCAHLRLAPGHRQPHVCTLWRIRTGPMRMPNAAIFETLKRHCQYYKAKPTPPRKPDPGSSPENDSDLDIRI